MVIGVNELKRKTTSNQSEFLIFDQFRIRSNRSRTHKNFHRFSFLFDLSLSQLVERLWDINRTFENCLVIGTRGIDLRKKFDSKVSHIFSMDNFLAPNNHIVAEEEFLPFCENSFDLIVSNITLHTINDLPGCLLQIRRCLKPDGLFLAAFYGGDTLKELRDILMRTEIDLMGGASPRVFPFVSKQQVGALLQRAGFSLPVVDSDTHTVSYNTLHKLMHDLRGMGETNSMIAREKNHLGKDFFTHASDLYSQYYPDKKDKKRIEASFEIIYLAGWAPHESQQKPLAPGSAQYSMADILCSDD